MRRRNDEGYVLSTRPLGEADLIVTLLTSETGKLHAVARAARRSRRRFGACLEPLTRVRASWTETEGRDLARLDSCDILSSYVLAQRDLGRFYLFAYISEVTGAFSREGEADPRFFRLVGAVLDEAAAGLPSRAMRRYFDLWTLRLQG
ncbi:MAG: DNA repair protein RecO, partial [Thermoplasmata archaeon]